MVPWYRVVTLRKEVREGRSFSPDEFAIALEQVVAETGPAPADCLISLVPRDSRVMTPRPLPFLTGFCDCHQAVTSLLLPIAGPQWLVNQYDKTSKRQCDSW